MTGRCWHAIFVSSGRTHFASPLVSGHSVWLSCHPRKPAVALCSSVGAQGNGLYAWTGRRDVWYAARGNGVMVASLHARYRGLGEEPPSQDLPRDGPDDRASLLRRNKRRTATPIMPSWLRPSSDPLRHPLVQHDKHLRIVPRAPGQ